MLTILLADTLLGIGMMTAPKLLLGPTSGCHLDLWHGTITYKLKCKLRWARTESLYRQYLCDKYKWEDSIYQDVD